MQICTDRLVVEGVGSDGLMGMGVSFWGVENVLELDRSVDYTTPPLH